MGASAGLLSMGLTVSLRSRTHSPLPSICTAYLSQLLMWLRIVPRRPFKSSRDVRPFTRTRAPSGSRASGTGKDVSSSSRACCANLFAAEASGPVAGRSLSEAISTLMAQVMASKSHPCTSPALTAISMAALKALSESAYFGLLLPRVDACINAAHPRRHAVSASPRSDAARASASSSRLGRQMLVHGAAASFASIPRKCRHACVRKPRRCGLVRCRERALNSQAKFSFRHRGHRTGVHTGANSTPLEGPWTPSETRHTLESHTDTHSHSQNHFTHQGGSRTGAVVWKSNSQVLLPAKRHRAGEPGRTRLTGTVLYCTDTPHKNCMCECEGVSLCHAGVFF